MRYIITTAHARQPREDRAMPDPALLALVQHFASPPALAQPAIMADAEPFLSAYEAIVADQDRAFAEWLVGEANLRRKTRLAVEADPGAFTPAMFDEIIGPFEHHLRRQKRITARLERRSTLHMSPRLRQLRERTLARQHQQYEAGHGLVAFLLEVRDDVIARQQAEAPSIAWMPNETTIAAMREAEAGGLPRFATVADLMADLHADD